MKYRALRDDPFAEPLSKFRCPDCSSTFLGYEWTNKSDADGDFSCPNCGADVDPEVVE